MWGYTIAGFLLVSRPDSIDRVIDSTVFSLWLRDILIMAFSLAISLYTLMSSTSLSKCLFLCLNFSSSYSLSDSVSLSASSSRRVDGVAAPSARPYSLIEPDGAIALTSLIPLPLPLPLPLFWPWARVDCLIIRLYDAVDMTTINYQTTALREEGLEYNDLA